MRNIRLYIGGQRVDLDSSVNIPFTYQTSDAEMPTSVKNSYSKTVSLKGTDRNSRVFGGIWHLDSRVMSAPAPGAARYETLATENDAVFTYRSVPSIAQGDLAKIAKVKGYSLVWNQQLANGNFASTSGWASVYNTNATRAVSGNVLTLTIIGASAFRAVVRHSVSIPAGHKVYWHYTMKINTSVDYSIITGYLGPTNDRLDESHTDQWYSDWKTVSGVVTTSVAKTYLYLGRYGAVTTQYPNVNDTIQIKNAILVDLTKMYGAGNEPTAEEFEKMYPLEWYNNNAAGTLVSNCTSDVEMQDAGGSAVSQVSLGLTSLASGGSAVFPEGMRSAGSVYDEVSGDTAIVRIGKRAYTAGDESDPAVVTDGTNTFYALPTPGTYTLDAPLPSVPVSFVPGGRQERLPQDSSSTVNAPFRGDLEYGMKIEPALDGNFYFNPMKRVPFLLYVDEMVVERGYCQLTAITRKGRDYTFSVSLFGGLGEFFYNLQTGSDGESRKLSDLDFGSDLGFKINAAHVQQVWDDMIGGTLPTVGFVPMHNGVPKNIDADKVLVKGGGLPASVTDGGNTYSAKDGYILASAERKYTEWEIGDLRSYLQRPALRLKDFFSAVFNPSNNGGWTVVADPLWFDSSNPYYENTYILLPQLNVEESTDDVCDDGTVTPFSDYPATSTKVSTLGLNSGCMTIVSDYVDMSAQASNAYLSLSLPVQLALTGVSAQGPLYMTNRVSHHTENKTICMMAAAYDDQNNLLAVSNRYVFTSKSHRNETGDVKKPAAPVSTTDAQIDGYFDYDYDANEYRFRLDENPADTFALLIEKIQRPSSALHRVQVKFYIQMTTDGIPTVNRWRYGDNLGNVYVSNTQFQCRILSGSNNSLKLVEPTQYSSDSQVNQTALLNSLDVTPLDLLLSVTKTFGLMWLQDNQENTVRLMQRPTYYTGEVRDIHDRIDYSKGLKVTPVSAESNNYVLANEYPETDLSEAYKSDHGRTYGEVRLSVGYDFGKDKVEMMEKVKLLGYVDGALSGAGYWSYRNADGNIPSIISGGIKVTYYHDSGGTTDTKDIDYNLFNVSALEKRNSIPLGVACQNDDGEEKGEEVAPSLVFLSGGKADGTYYLSDDISAMATLNNGPCWIWDESRTPARIPKFGRVATFSGETYSLDFGTPRMTYYIPEVSLAPEQAIYHRYWEKYLTDLLSRDTKKVEAYVVFPPHLDMREEMRKFYLFDRTLWVLNKVTDYDATKTQSVKCEFIRVNLKDSYTSY